MGVGNELRFETVFILLLNKRLLRAHRASIVLDAGATMKARQTFSLTLMSIREYRRHNKQQQ